MKTKHLLFAGYLIPIFFWVTTIICGFILGDYNHLSRLVSELGTIGIKSQYFFTSGLVLSSVFSALFVIGLYRVCRKVKLKTIPILLILTFSFSIFGAAIFPLPLKLHGILGSPSIIMFISPLLALILWKREKISSIKQFSLFVFILMVTAFIAFIPNFLSEFAGLKQRIFHLAWSIWFIYLAQAFTRLNKTQSYEGNN